MIPLQPKHADPLEDLLSTALIESANLQGGRKGIRTKADWNDHYRASYTRPENWSLRSQVQLIHVEGTVHTLVGLFDELVHTYIPGCRRLTATLVANEALPRKVEEVRGEHWLPGDRMLFKRQPSERTLELVADLTLDMGQHLRSEAVLCTASLVGGGLQRLCLRQDTLFEGNTPRTVLALPAGLDVLEGVLGGCKVLVWRQIQEEVARGSG